MSKRMSERSTILSSSVPAQMSPPTAVRSIISSFLKDKQLAIPTEQAKPSSRVRPERRFGENITSGNLLQELRARQQAKKDKEERQKSRR